MASSQPQPVDLLAKLILLIVEDSRHWDNTANSCESFIESLPQPDQEKMALNCAVYRERAALLLKFVSDIKNELHGDEPKAPRERNAGCPFQVRLATTEAKRRLNRSECSIQNRK